MVQCCVLCLSMILTTESGFYASVLCPAGSEARCLGKQMCPRQTDKCDPSLMIVIKKTGRSYPARSQVSPRTGEGKVSRKNREFWILSN